MRFLLLFLLSSSAFGQGTVSSTCVWSGSVADCLPSGGLLLRNQRDLRLGEANVNGSNYVALQAPATLASNVTLTLPSDDGNNFEVMVTDGSGNLDFNQITSPSYFSTGAEVTQSAPGVVLSAGQLKGTNTNDNAAAGYVGEYNSTVTHLNTGTAFSTGGAAQNMASMSLTAGDWDVTAKAGYTYVSSPTVNAFLPSISLTSATDNPESRIYAVPTPNSVDNKTFIGGLYRRISISSTTTIYLVSGTYYSGGEVRPSTDSQIWARRVR